jgi:hypothetical protein
MPSASPLGRALAGFIAGFLSVLLFHQVASALLVLLGLSTNQFYSMRPVPPFGMPQVLSLAFWGGVWGVVLAFVLPWLPRRLPGWARAALFGGLAPVLVGWFLVAPLKGLPVAQGGDPRGMLRSLFVNAAWGLGTFVFLRAVERLPVFQRGT